MKTLLITALLIMSSQAAVNEAWILENGHSKEMICKNGYLTTKYSGKINGKKFVIEEQFCDKRDAWDGECNHSIIPCGGKKNED